MKQIIFPFFSQAGKQTLKWAISKAFTKALTVLRWNISKNACASFEFKGQTA